MISNKNILKQNSRREIYEFISKNPGTHIGKISKEKKMSKSSVIYHLKVLKKQGLIEEKTNGMYRRIYLIDSIGSKEKELVDLLRQDTPRKIFIYLGFSISFTKSELSKELNLTPSTIDHHVKKFLKLGIIEKAPIKKGKLDPNRKGILMLCKNVSNEVYYRRKEQWPLNVMWKFLVKNKDSFNDKNLIKSYEDYLKNCGIKRQREIISINAYIDNISKALYDICPVSFIA